MTPAAPDAKIIARDLLGAEHTMTVVTRCGLICVQDEIDARIYHVDHALELSWQIIRAVIKIREREAGPFSSTF